MRRDPLHHFPDARTFAPGASFSTGQNDRRFFLPSQHQNIAMQTISKTLMPKVFTSLALVALLTLSASAHANPQRVQFQANFLEADVDKNDQLNMAEFKTFINLNADHKLGRAVSIRRFGMYTQAFKAIDANGDGVVTKEEIAAQANH